MAVCFDFSGFRSHINCNMLTHIYGSQLERREGNLFLSFSQYAPSPLAGASTSINWSSQFQVLHQSHYTLYISSPVWRGMSDIWEQVCSQNNSKSVMTGCFHSYTTIHWDYLQRHGLHFAALCYADDYSQRIEAQTYVCEWKMLIIL